MRKHNLAFVDVETTGLDPRRHEIIELGCLVVRQDWTGSAPRFTVLCELDLKIKPQHIETAEPEALRINRYSEADWLFAVDVRQAMENFTQKAQDAILVGQNIAFDAAFLDEAFRATGVQSRLYYHKLDLIPMVFAKYAYDKKLERFNLRELCNYFGIKNELAHSAMSDVRATFAIFKKVLGALE